MRWSASQEGKQIWSSSWWPTDHPLKLQSFCFFFDSIRPSERSPEPHLCSKTEKREKSIRGVDSSSYYLKSSSLLSSPANTASVYAQIELGFTISQSIHRDVSGKEVKRGRFHGLTVVEDREGSMRRLVVKLSRSERMPRHNIKWNERMRVMRRRIGGRTEVSQDSEEEADEKSEEKESSPLENSVRL